MRSFFFFLLALALFAPNTSIAQSFDDLGEPTVSFSVSASPDYPEPYGKAVLSFVSSSIDLNAAMLSVSANGKKVYGGTVQPVTVVLGKAGSITRIVATITANGAAYEQTLTLQPQDVVLVAEPVASVPPLYPGKPAIPLEGSVRIVAMANLVNSAGVSLDPRTLSYAWTVDGTKIAKASGIGKDVLMVASPFEYRTREVSVLVMRPDGSLAGGSSLSLSPRQPWVRLYENDPLLGIRFDRALTGTHSIAAAESSLYGAPFSLPTTGGAPRTEWFLNGSSAQTGNTVTLRPTGSGKGSASLSFVASAADTARATANLSILFGEQSGFNLFGL